MRRVDLHCHSTASDGTDAPEALARLAARAGLAAFALTDHDTLAGLAEARSAGEAAGVEVVPGVELAARVPAGEMHVLGYFVAEDHPGFQARLRELRDGRRTRVRRTVERLAELGAPVTEEEVLAHAKGAAGRPHVALALVARGHARDVAEAFDRFLARGRPAFVPRDEMTPAECVGWILRAGGAAVLAHPSTLPADAIDGHVADLARRGLAGVEVQHPKNDPALRERLLALAKEHDLVATGGSDYHGTNKPGVVLGHGVGEDVRVGYEVVEELRARL